MNIATTFITLNDGTEICAPKEANLMSNYVLREQGDWFEDEIHFVRNFIQPGMIALDIGANYGLYSTAIAKNLGDNGKLWCFEPTPNTAKALRSTIERNNLDSRVEIIEAGLSDHTGTATFYLSPNAELNSLTTSTKASETSLTIKLLTLDQCQLEYNWQSIDFIKLDAEGEEANILKQSTKTLEDFSPLIMFELKHGEEINHSLIGDFKNLGYEPYYLIPGIDILAPLNLSVPIDGFLLNLFCCKASTAKLLEKDGYLVSTAETLQGKDDSKQDDFFAQIPAFSSLDKRVINDQNYQQVINAYIGSRDETLDKQQRYQHLLFAFEIVKGVLNQGESKIERLSTYARIAFDVGQRSVGLQICNYVINKYLQDRDSIKIDEPYVPVNGLFESTAQKLLENDWLLASFIDEYIRKHAYSCYFTHDKAIPYFNTLKKMGFMLPDMERREQTLLNLIKSIQG
jgi:protein O-GlcNAc transferase